MTERAATGEATTARATRRGGPQRIAWILFGTLFVGFLISPILLVVVFSFSDRPITNFPIEALSLVWWRQMLGSIDFAAALQRSLQISGTVAVIGTIIGTMTAAGLMRLRERWTRTILVLGMTPVAMPPLILAVALLVSFVRSGLGLGMTAVIIAHLLITIPLVTLIVYGRLKAIDPILVECARDLGASPFRAGLTVTAPLAAPAVVGAALMIFAISIDEFVLTSFTLGGGNTLPTLVWGMMRTGAMPVVNAIGTVMIALSMGMVLLGVLIARMSLVQHGGVR